LHVHDRRRAQDQGAARLLVDGRGEDREAGGEMTTPLDTKPILDGGFRFFASKGLRSAVELGVFTELAKGPRTRDELGSALKIHPRGSIDLFHAPLPPRLLAGDGGGTGPRPRHN